MTTQAQYSLADQLDEMRDLAVKSGLYDAVDWLERVNKLVNADPCSAYPEPLEAELPVCPQCRKVGPQPKGFGKIKNLCNGGVHNPHPRRSMTYKLFREVV